MESDQVPILAELPAGVGAHFHISWGAGSELKLCEVGGTDNRPGPASKVHLVQWGCLPSAQRQVAYDSQKIYSDLQTKRRSTSEDLRLTPKWSSTVLQYSRSISAILSAKCSAIQEEAEAGRTQQDAGTLALLLQCAGWELVELAMVKRGAPEGVLTEELVHWLRRNHTVLAPDERSAAQLQKQVLEQMRDYDNPEDVPQYWDAVCAVTAVGWVDDAITLLGLHSVMMVAATPSMLQAETYMQSEREVLEAGLALLQQMPRLQLSEEEDASATGYTSVAEYSWRREGWRQQGLALLQARQAALWEGCRGATTAGLQTMLAVLFGDDQAIQASTSGWVEMLVAQVLHVYPTLSNHVDVRALVEHCTQQCPPHPIPILERLALAVLDDNVVEVISVVSQALGPWFLAHLTQSLTGGGGAALPATSAPLPGRQGGYSQEEHYTLEYVLSLAPHPTLLHLAATYLTECPRMGAAVLQELLGRQWIGGDARAATKAYHLSLKHGVPTQAAQIARTIGRHKWREGHQLAAVHWLQRAQDYTALAAIAKRLFVRYGEERPGSRELALPSPSMEELEDLERMVEVLGAAHIPSGMLVFVQRYCGLRRLLQDIVAREAQLPPPVAGAAGQGAPHHHAGWGGGAGGAEAEELCRECTEAKDAVLALVHGRLAPRSFWGAVMYDVVLLLEGSRIVFSAHETHALMARLQEISLAAGNANTLSRAAAPHLQVVQLALARNLARAILIEGEQMPPSQPAFCVF